MQMSNDSEKDTIDSSFNESEAALILQEFRPTIPQTVTNGIQLSKDPVKRQEIKRDFLTILRSTANVLHAAKACKIPTAIAYIWRAEDPEFAFKWDKIIEAEMLPHLEAEAIRRAINGSDTLMMFMLKALNRSKYDDKLAEKAAERPSITIQMLDVDKTIITAANDQLSLPATNYIDGQVIDVVKK
jgi:hypothetical protein